MKLFSSLIALAISSTAASTVVQQVPGNYDTPAPPVQEVENVYPTPAPSMYETAATYPAPVPSTYEAPAPYTDDAPSPDLYTGANEFKSSDANNLASVGIGLMLTSLTLLLL